MTRVSTKDWRNLPIEKYNVTSFHAFLIDRNRELFNAEYVPFGKGSITNRWATEKGQIKTAIGNYGNAVIKRYIEICIAKHRPKREYPSLSWGFMFAYMRNELAQAQQEIARESRRKEAQVTKNDGMTDDEIIDLL